MKLIVATLTAILIIATVTPLAVACNSIVVTPCDADGNEVNQFAAGEGVYITTTGLPPNKNYKVWIQLNPVLVGDLLVLGENPLTAETPKTVTTDASGNIACTLIWAIPLNALIAYQRYVVVIDRKPIGKYGHNDGMASFDVVGGVPPVPDASSLILFASGIVLVWFVGVRGRSRD